MAGKGFFGTDDDKDELKEENQTSRSDEKKAFDQNSSNDAKEIDEGEISSIIDEDESRNEEPLSKEKTDAEPKEKVKGFFDKIKSEKDKINKEEAKNFGSFIRKILKKPTGGDVPPPSSSELEKKSKNKIVAIAGVFLLVLFGVKTFFEEDSGSRIKTKIESPDTGSTSLFGNYDLAVGVVKGQIVTNNDVKRQIEEATIKMHEEMAKLRAENQGLRRKEIVIAQGSMNQNSTPYLNNDMPPISPDEMKSLTNKSTPSAGALVAPKLPAIHDPLQQSETIIAPPPPASIDPTGMSRSGNSYPMVGQGSSTPTGRSDFGVSGEKVYSYSPVTDAVKGVAGAVKDSFNGATGQGVAGGVNSSDPVAIVPASTIVAGVMLSGLDAPTGKGSSGNPMPIVMQLMDNGTTASFFQVPIKGCRIILAGYGDLPSERVYMRLERLVCIAETGEVYSASASGVVLGEDGKNGMRGRVVDKQGALILRSMLAGMMQGAGDVFQTLQQQTLASAATGIVTSGGLSGGDLGRSAIGGALSQSSKRLADFYMKKASKLYPIIEINPGRDVEVLFTRDLQFFPISKIVGKAQESTGSLGGYWDIPVGSQQ